MLGCRHLAASEGSFAVCEWLVRAGARIDALDRFKRTPLEVCSNVLLAARSPAAAEAGALQDAINGHFNEVSKFLMDNGAKIHREGQVRAASTGLERLALAACPTVKAESDLCAVRGHRRV